MLARRVQEHSLTRFLAFSTVGYGVDLILLALLRAAGLFPLWADVTIAFWLTYALNFTLNRSFAFHASHRGDLRTQLLRYLPQVLVDYALTLGAVELLTALAGLGVVPARMAAGASNATFNYLAYRFWTFRARHRTDGPRVDADAAADS